MATAAPPAKRVYLYRLLTLTIDQGNIVVRNIFDQAISNVPLQQFLAKERNAISHLKATKVITKVQFELLFPPSGNPPPTTADFDLTLAICLLRNLQACNLNPNFKWKARPQPGDTSLEADIRRLQMFRNELVHIPSTDGIEQLEFNQKWHDTELVLNRLNGSLRTPVPHLQQDIKDCKTKHLDPEAQQYIETHIKSMQDLVNDLQKNVTKKLSDMSKRMDVFEDQKIPEDLHKVVGYIYGQMIRMNGQMIRMNAEKQAERKGLKELETIMQANCDDQEKRKKATDVLFDIVKLIQTGHKFSEEEVKTMIRQRIEWYGELTVRLIKDVIDWFSPIVEIPDIRIGLACIGSIRIPIKCFSEDGRLKQMHFMNSKECIHCLLRISSTLSKLLGFPCSITWSVVPDSLTDVPEKQNTGESTSKTPTVQQDKYQQMKKQLKEDLITLYRQKYYTLPLSPLFEENDTPLLQFYVMPDINKVEIQRSLGGGKEHKSKLTTLREVFYKENKLYRDIYLLADAGLGKTAFSKRLVLTWCQAHKCIENEIECFEKPQTDVMSQFEFVFLLPLRECSDECDIDEMIRKQIVPELANTPENIETVLSKENCLVILNGLDEWEHPTSPCPLKPRDIPHRKAREKCTVITTASPWRLSVINLDSTKINQKFELEGLNKEARYKLKNNVISQYMPGATKEQVREQIDKFDSGVANKGISDLETIPLLLLYLLCLWHDNIDLGRSKCEIYCQIVELLLKRAFTKHPELRSTHGSWLSKIPSLLSVFYEKHWAYLTSFFQAERPQCFREQKHCKEHFTFLTAIGELAFERLFSETKENRLVFDSSIAEKCLTEDFLELGRLTGIVTQDEQSKLLSQIRKTSFSHKTVQEFFAALYISTCYDQYKVLTKVLSFCNSIQDILNLSKVFIFISGINAELFSLLSIELMTVINKDEITSKHRSTADHYSQQPLKDIQEMFVSCFKEVSDNKDVTICLQDFFFEWKCRQDNYYKSLQRLALQNKTNIKSIYIEDLGGRSLTEIIDDCDLSDPQIQCQKLFCCCECKEEDTIRLLSTSVKCLYIHGIQRDHECKEARSSLTDKQCKTFHNSSQLETIEIRRSTVSHKFLNYIINVKSIREITLSSLSCSEHESLSSEHESSSTEHESSGIEHESSSSEHESSCPVFNFDLSQHSELRELVLRGNFTFCDINKDESSLLHKMRNIEHVLLYGVKMSSLSLRWFVEIIEKLEHSVKVELRFCEIIPREEFEDIRDYIRRSESFVVEKDVRNWRDRDVFEFVTKK